MFYIYIKRIFLNSYFSAATSRSLKQGWSLFNNSTEPEFEKTDQSQALKKFQLDQPTLKW